MFFSVSSISSQNAGHTASKVDRVENGGQKEQFKRPNHITDQLYEVELVKSDLEHRDSTIVGFFILQYPQQRMLEFHYSFFKNFVTLTSMKNLKWIPIHFTYFFPEKVWKMSFFPKIELNGISYLLNVALISLLRVEPAIFSPELAVMPTRKKTRESRASSKKKLDMQKRCVPVAKHTVVMISILTNTSITAKDSIKEPWKRVAMTNVKVSQSVRRGSQRYFNQ